MNIGIGFWDKQVILTEPSEKGNTKISKQDGFYAVNYGSNWNHSDIHAGQWEMSFVTDKAGTKRWRNVTENKNEHLQNGKRKWKGKMDEVDDNIRQEVNDRKSSLTIFTRRGTTASRRICTGSRKLDPPQCIDCHLRSTT